MPRPSLISTTLVLTFAVITLGAYVRLSNAGLGCPDWPGCYGRLIVPEHVRVESAVAHARAWIEMVHRYAAGVLGLSIAVLAWLAFRGGRGRRFAVALTVLVIFQALLGMWTVTLRLQPVIVMGHLLGGLALLSLLWLWRLSASRHVPNSPLRGAAAAAVLVVVSQIALGGWTSANYAAVACADFPTCQGQWWPDADFDEGFSLPAAVAGSWEGGGHTGAGRTAIHLAHRLGAVAAVLVVGLFATGLLRAGGPLRRAGLVLGIALLGQFFLGAANVLLSFPLSLAVAHTAGAALLLLAVLWSARSVLTR
ncbi:MAG: COX15/CtaA family protein [Gammaproteobacteria bacterium]|nr:COX15/CtaA family protein [Gammaproteobacteria bacterium]